MTNSRTTVAQVLKEHGYHTAAFHTNPWVSSLFGYKKGFDTFDDGIQKWRVESLLSKPKELAERMIGTTGRFFQVLSRIYAVLLATYFISKAEVLNKKAISWLHGNPNNFFLWIHYMDCHEPYLPSQGIPSPFKREHIGKLFRKTSNHPRSLSPGKLNELIHLYDSKVSYVDEMIGSLLRILRTSNILDNTFVIVTADHGQQLGEHGSVGHGGWLYDELIYVRLIITGPGLESEVIGQQVSLLDLAPTILDMLKIEKPQAFLGNSLLPLISGNRARAGNSEAISETDTITAINRVSAGIRPQLDANHRRISLRTGKWKYIYTEGEQNELYDLENDPKETQTIIEIKPEIATELRTKIMAHIEFEDKSTPVEEELIKAKIRKLKASGKL